MPSISVIIPASNSGQHLARCLAALQLSDLCPLELIVINDGSTDDTFLVASRFTAHVISTDRRRGPAFARNLGASLAIGDILLFLDSDVCVHKGTVSQVVESFERDTTLDAVMGSYDDKPESQDFLSQYRNLMHAYVHRTGASQASTFWSGCGAIRRDVFLQHSGFDESYKRPAIEDIELGYRLKLAGRKLMLDHRIEVTHLKRWTFWNLVTTDIMERGIPWTELILRDRFMPDDLNLQLSQKVSVALVFALVALSGIMAFLSGAYLVFPLIAAVFIMLTAWWSETGKGHRPRQAITLLFLMVGLIAALAYKYRMYVLLPPLMISPVLLLLKHRYHKGTSEPAWHRWVALWYVCLSAGVALFYFPAHVLLDACFLLLVAIAVLKQPVLYFSCWQAWHSFYDGGGAVSFAISLLQWPFISLRSDKTLAESLASEKTHNRPCLKCVC